MIVVVPKQVFQECASFFLVVPMKTKMQQAYYSTFLGGDSGPIQHGTPKICFSFHCVSEIVVGTTLT
jgi:hypothetical protein